MFFKRNRERLFYTECELSSPDLMAGYYREGLVNVQQFIISIVIIIVIIDNIIINRPILSFCICLNVGQCETERERERGK